jgi:ParB/RepB/Spo0J family partition protein
MTSATTTSNTITIRLSDIGMPSGRMRRLHEKLVERLATSIAQQGQLQPIIVRPGATAGSYTLVAGLHRVEAVRRHGGSTIRAVVRDDLDDDDALLVEIDENLMRAELSPAERKLHIGRRAELYEKKYGKAKAKGAHAANKKMGRKTQAPSLADAFTTETAKKTGKSERSVQRDVQHAKAVPVLDRIVGTSLDTGEEITALAKLPKGEQRKLAERAKSGEQVSAKPAPARDDIGPASSGEYARLNADIEQVRRERRQLEIKIVGLESEVADLKSANDGLRKALDEAGEKLRKASEGLAELEQLQQTTIAGLESENAQLKAVLEKDSTERAEALYAALEKHKVAGYLPITDQLLVLVGALQAGLTPIKQLAAALQLPPNASLKRQSQLEGLQAMVGIIFDRMSVVHDYVLRIKRDLDDVIKADVGDLAAPATATPPPADIPPSPADDGLDIPPSLRRVPS